MHAHSPILLNWHSPKPFSNCVPKGCRLRPFASNQDCCVIYFFLCFLRGVGRSGLKHFKTSNDCPDYGILYWRYLWCVCVCSRFFSARTQDLIRVHTYLYNLIISTLHVELKKCILRCLISRPPFFPKARLGVYSSFSSYVHLQFKRSNGKQRCFALSNLTT